MSPKQGVSVGTAPQTLTVREATRILGLRMESVYRLIYSGHLFAFQENGQWKVSKESVEDYRQHHLRAKAEGEGSQGK